jgi:hypothetical protein
MSYPSMESVESADQLQLCRWYRFLPSPGADAIGGGDREVFNKLLSEEKPVMDRICERVKDGGGFTPAISKAIGL